MAATGDALIAEGVRSVEPDLSCSTQTASLTMSAKSHGFGLERNKLMENRLRERGLLPRGVIHVVIDHRPLSRHGSVNLARSRLIVAVDAALLLDELDEAYPQ